MKPKDIIQRYVREHPQSLYTTAELEAALRNAGGKPISRRQIRNIAHAEQIPIPSPGGVRKNIFPERLRQARKQHNTRIEVRRELGVSQHTLEKYEREAGMPPNSWGGSKPHRERRSEVLALKKQGLTNKVIAKRLHVGETAIQAMLQRIQRDEEKQEKKRQALETRIRGEMRSRHGRFSREAIIDSLERELKRIGRPKSRAELNMIYDEVTF